VVLDTDDVVLDANLFPGEVIRTGKWGHYEYWMNWAKSAHASLIPGARTFIDTVHELGGHVIIVTDHLLTYCSTTRARLAELEIGVDAVMCAEHVDSSKDARFDAIQRGAAVPSLGPLDIAMYLGSQPSDFPQGAAYSSHAAEYGVRLFLLPDFKGR
jgi:predicted secreted acid phosphatase